MRASRDGLALWGLLIGLAAVTTVSLATSPNARPGAPARAPWCEAEQSPELLFGFADLAHALEGQMGEPVECEHGDAATGNDLQKTTHGLAVYTWCTNTSSFLSNDGQNAWALLPGGLAHWTPGEPPPDPPIVRVPDLRHPCPA